MSGQRTVLGQPAQRLWSYTEEQLAALATALFSPAEWSWSWGRSRVDETDLGAGRSAEEIRHGVVALRTGCRMVVSVDVCVEVHTGDSSVERKACGSAQVEVCSRPSGSSRFRLISRYLGEAIQDGRVKALAQFPEVQREMQRLEDEDALRKQREERIQAQDALGECNPN